MSEKTDKKLQIFYEHYGTQKKSADKENWNLVFGAFCLGYDAATDAFETWQGLMSILNKIYPSHIFLQTNKKITENNFKEFQDIGVVVINLIRRLDKIRAENTALKEKLENLETENSLLRRQRKGIFD